MFYLLVNNIFFFIQKVKSKRKKGKKESKSLTVRGKTILGRTSGNPGFGVTGFQVTDNPENRINPDKPKHIFDNVLMKFRDAMTHRPEIANQLEIHGSLYLGYLGYGLKPLIAPSSTVQYLVIHTCLL